MSDPYEDFLSRWVGVDPLDGPASPARDLVLAAQFEDEVENGGLAQKIFYPDEPALAAARIAYLEANRAALATSPQERARGARPK